MANKYDHQARQLVKTLEGTKWSAAVAPSSRDPVERFSQRIGDYIREKPIASLVMAGAFAFAYGALRSIGRRV